MPQFSSLATIASFDWFAWGVALLVGLPLLVILLGEMSRRLVGTRRQHFMRPLDLFRGSALFLLFTTILLRVVVGLPATHLAVMIVDTAFWITVLNACLALSNAIMFEGAGESGEPRAPKLLVDLGRVFLVAVGAALIVSYVWNVDLTGLFAALGVGSLVIGLALQDTLGNIFSGVTMLSTSSLRVGRWIRIGDIEGQVRSVNWRSVRVVTASGDIFDIPNSQIAKDKLRVIGADRGWTKSTIDVKAPYRFPPESVKSAIARALAETKNILAEPKPGVSILAYDGEAIVYRVTFGVADFTQAGGARGELLANLWYVAARDGLTFETSSGDSTPAPAPASTPDFTVTKLEEIGALNRPRHVLERLAEGAKIELYRRGEALLNAGEPSEAAFVVIGGVARAAAPGEDGGASTWAFNRGDLILFKSFFRDGPSPVGVVCET